MYAGWATKPPCTVTFNANGGYFGEYSNSETTMTVTVLNGTCVLQPNNPSYMFMVFSGWYTESECKNKYDLNTSVTKNITLYAGWIPVHSINFESNGNSYFDYQYVVEGDLLICPDEIPENYGKVFTGWYTEPECTNLYDFNSPVTSSFTLYAGWGEKLIYHTITFDANGGTLTSEPTQAVLRYGKITEPSNPTREGYTFTGWYDDKRCTDLIDFDYIVVDHDRTLYAGWTVTTYTVTFNANGGNLTSDPTQAVLRYGKITEPSNPTREGYTFTGWYTDLNCSNLYDFNSQVTSDFTLYAGWNKVCKITRILNGGSLTGDTTLTVISGDRIYYHAQSDPIRSGYTFTGWYTDSSCTILYDFSSKVTSDFTLYAGWSVATCTVSFNANGGVLTDDTNQTVSSGSTVTQPSNPTRNEYDFTGWYTDIDCTNKYDFENQITSSFTLYAGWEIKNYTVSFNANGGTLTSNTIQTVSSGSKVTEPSIPTRSGYAFTGWYTNTSCTSLYDFNSQTTSDFTLYAGWKTLEEYIPYIFNSLEGEGPHDIVFNGEFTEEIMNLVITEIKDSNVKIDLDLRNTKGLKWLEGFNGCTSLTSIKIPISVTSISDSAFEDCTSLSSIEIPTSVGRIGKSAFKGCTGITSIEIPTSVNYICDSTFEGCTGLTSIEIPISVRDIYNSAFKGCTSLKSVKIPTSITCIASSVFEGCTGLTSIEIPTSVTSISDSAFEGCTSLSSIEIPTSVTSIGVSVFSGCTSLKKIELPTTITSIGMYAFSFCTSLKNIEIPTSVISIDVRAFYRCTGLTSITFKDTTAWIYKPDDSPVYGTEISVASPSTNATNLTVTYVDYFWYKKIY